MTPPYDFKQLFDVYKSDLFFEDYYSADDYKYWVESYVEINKPDFIAVMNLSNTENPVVYSHNFNLEFPVGSNESVYEIVNAVSQEHLHRILEADRMCFKFLETSNFIAKSPLFQLRFTVTLKDKPIALLRDVVFIPDRNQNKLLNVFLVAFTNITDLDGTSPTPKIEIKHHLQDLAKIKKLEKFKKKLTNVLLGKKVLTAREEQILNLIAEGMSSTDIAEHLQISVNTINTHRQNLIRKFGVKNINALINMI